MVCIYLFEKVVGEKNGLGARARRYDGEAIAFEPCGEFSKLKTSS
ncbi:hypothetical protein [[Limnothrix rosea] IAM M-220]|nr:hypothetical protein [[Limnothrix rosea] IAM M-220]